MTSIPATPTLFISYRRDDASARAGRLCDWLKRQFGAERVFLDTEQITAGAQFPQVLADRLAQADVLLAVIGPQWLDARNAQGRRLDQADDFVRQEVAGALAAGKRVVPVLVGGATMPTEAQLPEALRPLARCNAAQVDDASFERDFNVLVDDLLGRPRGYLRRELDRLTRLVRALKLTAALVPTLALAAVLALWVGLLAPLNVDDLARNGLLWAADALDPLPADAGVLVVAIDDASEAALGPPAFGPSAHWRALHARLIDRAVAAGARAVAFDIAFITPTEADATLAAAATRAANTDPPVPVILGGHRLNGDRPALAPALSALPWGTTCLLRRDQRYAVPMAVLAPTAQLEVTVPVRLSAFALLASQGAAAVEADLDRRSLRLAGSTASPPPRFTSLERIDHADCDTLRAGDTVARLAIRSGDPEAWHTPARHIAYRDALDPATDPARLRGRVLVVGDARSTSPDRHPLRHGLSTHSVPGVQLHAAAIATLIHHREPIEPTVDQALFALVLASLTGAAGGFLAAPLRRWPRHGVLAALCLGYLALAVLLAWQGVLLNLPYDLTALLLAWAVLHRLQRPERIEESAP